MYWITMGLIYLGVLTYQDIFNKRMIDDRYNYLMIGATVPLVVNSGLGLWAILVAIVVGVGISLLFGKMNVFGKGDLKAITWSFIGFATFGTIYLLYYMTIFTICYFGYIGFMNLLYKIRKQRFTGKVAGYPILFISFLMVISTNLIIFL